MGEKGDRRDPIRDFDDVLLHIGGWNRYQAKLSDPYVHDGMGGFGRLSVCKAHLSATRWTIYCCPTEKEGVSKEEP
jgi:hypothetical protein